MDQQILKGHSELIILAALARSPMHGYALSEAIRDQMPESFKFGVGMLYPLLHRLEKENHIVGEWKEVAGLRRRVYRLTKNGRKRLESKKREWASFSQLMNKAISPAV